jgi:hypothetical protein
LAFGEQNPLQGEIAISWQTLTDGAGSPPTVIGDSDWGKIELDITEEGRSRVYDFGDATEREHTLTEDRYGTGQGTATLQLRGQATIFLQDAASPSWEDYSVPVAKTWRFMQVRAIKQS